MIAAEIQPVIDFLKGNTPDSWYEAAKSNISILLVDHANCEKKAASAALGLMYKYVSYDDMLQKLSRLAREELRHFEMVLDLMKSQKVDYEYLSASDYAMKLRKDVRTHEPERLTDLLICGAVVEARSCERFYGLSKVLPKEISNLYSQLLKSEVRHFKDYMNLAAEVSSREEAWDRAEHFLTLDLLLITSTDSEFRFHSGVPN